MFVYNPRAIMDAIRYTVANKSWDTVDASPSVILNIDTCLDGPDGVRIRLDPNEFRSVRLAFYRISLSPISLSPTNKVYLFEVTLADYMTQEWKYDAVIGLVGSEKKSKLCVNFHNKEQDELIVPAGEFQPIWRRVTLFPALNFRTQDDTIFPLTLTLLSGPPPRVLVAIMTNVNRYTMGNAHTIYFPDGCTPIKWTGAQWAGGGVMELPDLVDTTGATLRNEQKKCSAITKELMETVWHPRRVMKMGGVDALDDL